MAVDSELHRLGDRLFVHASRGRVRLRILDDALGGNCFSIPVSNVWRNGQNLFDGHRDARALHRTSEDVVGNFALDYGGEVRIRSASGLVFGRSREVSSRRRRISRILCSSVGVDRFLARSLPVVADRRVLVSVCRRIALLRRLWGRRSVRSFLLVASLLESNSSVGVPRRRPRPTVPGVAWSRRASLRAALDNYAVESRLLAGRSLRVGVQRFEAQDLAVEFFDSLP